MRWVTHDAGDGARAGVVDNGTVRGLAAGSTLDGLVARGADTLREAGADALRSPAEVRAVENVRLLAPLRRPPSVRDALCFLDHLRGCNRALGRDETLHPAWDERPASYFANADAIAGPFDDVPSGLRPVNGTSGPAPVAPCDDLAAARGGGAASAQRTVSAGAAEHGVPAAVIGRPDPAGRHPPERLDHLRWSDHAPDELGRARRVGGAGVCAVVILGRLSRTAGSPGTPWAGTGGPSSYVAGGAGRRARRGKSVRALSRCTAESCSSESAPPSSNCWVLRSTVGSGAAGQSVPNRM